jgi:hypothetical protein
LQIKVFTLLDSIVDLINSVLSAIEERVLAEVSATGLWLTRVRMSEK